MILVTPGFEFGVGLEIFLKAIRTDQELKLDQFKLFVNKDILNSAIQSSDLDMTISGDILKIDNRKLNLYLLPLGDTPQTTFALESALPSIKSNDILLTLPTKKDQLLLNKKIKAGYTEYFREVFSNSNITMNFLSPTDNVLLLTDHIPLSKVEESITNELVLEKVSITLNNFPSSRSIKEVYFSGINPHCGEDGLIGSADLILKDSIELLRSSYPGIVFHDPKAGDTLSFSHKGSEQLFVYAFHDQGLAPFKAKNGLIGINLTLGLPFKRVSVDHGTAPDIFGKNMADYSGMRYLLSEVNKW